MMGAIKFLVGILFFIGLSIPALAQSLSSRAVLHEVLNGEDKKEAVALLKVNAHHWVAGFLTVQLKFDHATYPAFQTSTVSFKDAQEIDLVLIFNPLPVGENLSEIFFSGDITFKHEKQNTSGSCLVTTDISGRWNSANCFLNKKDYIALRFTP